MSDFTSDWARDTWRVMESFLTEPGALNQSNQESFRYFIETWIPALLTREKMKATDWNDGNYMEVRLKDCRIQKPTTFRNRYQALTPALATAINSTYSSAIDVTVVIERRLNGQVESTTQQVKLCNVPIMVNSVACHLHGRSTSELVRMGECPFHEGGHFITNGKDRVIVPQHRPSDNEPFVFNNPLMVVVKSTLDQRFYPIRVTSVTLSKKNELMVSLPYGKSVQPVSLVFKALGVITDRDIAECLRHMDFPLDSHIIANTLDHPNAAYVFTQEEAQYKLAQFIQLRMPNTEDMPGEKLREMQVKKVNDVLSNYFLPHTGQDVRKKVWYLSRMCHLLLRASRDSSLFTDRDSLKNKRVDMPGEKLSQIFRFCFHTLTRNIKDELRTQLGHGTSKSMADVTHAVLGVINANTIGKKLCSSVLMGNWFTTRQTVSKTINKGVSQSPSPLSYLSILSHTARRHQSPIETKGSKHKPPRVFHQTHESKLCPSETPEGAQIGTRLNMALLCTVTVETSTVPALYCLDALGMIPLSTMMPGDMTTHVYVSVNGDYVGLLETPEKAYDVVQSLRFLKLTGRLNKKVSVAWSTTDNHVRVNTCGGRYVVPYYRVDEDNHFVLDMWAELYRSAAVDLPLNIGVLSTGIENEKVRDVYTANAPLFREFNRSGKNSADLPLGLAAAVEYLDSHEEEEALIADTPERLYNGQTLRCVSGNMIGHLTYAVSAALSDASAVWTECLRCLNNDEHANLLEIAVKRLVVLDETTRTIRLELAVPYKQMDGFTRMLLTNFNRYVSRDFNRYTHVMIHPAQVNGLLATTIPFSDKNQAPRNCYGSSMGKQALGMFCTNNHWRWDTSTVVMYNVQMPVVHSRIEDYIGTTQLPHGFIAILAMANYMNYNQEDSLDVNWDAAERGAFNTLAFRTYSKSSRLMGVTKETVSFELPSSDSTIGRKMGASGRDPYHAIGERQNDVQLPVRGVCVEDRDVIIPMRRMKKKSTARHQVYRDTSITVRMSGAGVVEKVMYDAEDGDGSRCVKVRVTETQSQLPHEGSKFASKHAQKGTVGIELRGADSLQLMSGGSPDLIMNPHAIPSRMTVGQLAEAKAAKYALVTGYKVDSTVFSDYDETEINAGLAALGYDYDGDEIVYTGMTGEPVVVNVTPTYYQRLKHMPLDKYHAREQGPIQPLTRQPTEGRMKNGGLRLGEMERDAILAHGASRFLKQMMCDNSDRATHYIDRDTGDFATVDVGSGSYQYGTRDVYESAARIEISHTTRVAIEELNQAMIGVELEVDTN